MDLAGLMEIIEGEEELAANDCDLDFTESTWFELWKLA
jgi:hypothetical protein